MRNLFPALVATLLLIACSDSTAPVDRNQLDAVRAPQLGCVWVVDHRYEPGGYYACDGYLGEALQVQDMMEYLGGPDCHWFIGGTTGNYRVIMNEAPQYNCDEVLPE